MRKLAHTFWFDAKNKCGVLEMKGKNKLASNGSRANR